MWRGEMNRSGSHRWSIAGHTFLVAALIVLGCASREPANAIKGVLLVSIDTLRADRIHAYGNGAISTPSSDSLAARWVLFENAFCTIPVTLPSHTSMMTGLYPHQHGVRDNGVYRVPEKVETLAEILQGEGWRTAAFVSAHVLDHSYRIDQGFDLYDDEMVEPLQQGDPIRPGRSLPDHTRRWLQTWTEPYQRKAELTATRAVEWLSGQREDHPFFCWVHLFDPHLSYTPPEPWDRAHSSNYDGPIDGTGDSFLKIARETKGRIPVRHVNRMIELYDGEVSYTDYWLGRLLEAIPDSTLVIFVSDHGEAFGEHGLFFEHQTSIFQETIRIPLIIAGPGVDDRGSRRTDLVSTIDIVPTVLDILGLRGTKGLAGEPLLRREVDPDRAIYTETHASLTAVPAPYCYKSVRTAEWCQIYRMAKPDKVVETFLHNIQDDYSELVNRYADAPGISRLMQKKFDDLIGLGMVHDSDPEAFWSLDEGEDRRKQLKALGYMGGN